MAGIKNVMILCQYLIVLYYHLDVPVMQPSTIYTAQPSMSHVQLVLKTFFTLVLNVLKELTLVTVLIKSYCFLL